jgi:molybdopterin-guanine dinucleotide biosynthesis protein A
MEQRFEAMLTVVVQAGGASQRMGIDKGLAPFLGRPMISRVMERLAPLADEILITTNRPEDYAFLGVRLETDLLPGKGALGGLYTALSAAQYPLVAVVACDMPFASPALIQAERDLLVEGEYEAVVPRTPHGMEPFHAIYRRQACLRHVWAALEAGKQRVDAWFPAARVGFMESSEIERWDASGLAFFNINTPEDLQKAVRLASI